MATFSVGGRSAVSAVAGAYADNLPVIFISGDPNTNYQAENQFMQHTITMHDFSYPLENARKLNCAAVSITCPSEAPEEIEHTLCILLREKKPRLYRNRLQDRRLTSVTPGLVGAVTAEARSGSPSRTPVNNGCADTIEQRRK